jgi:hypothetical protein
MEVGSTPAAVWEIPGLRRIDPSVRAVAFKMVLVTRVPNVRVAVLLVIVVAPLSVGHGLRLWVRKQRHRSRREPSAGRLRSGEISPWWTSLA